VQEDDTGCEYGFHLRWGSWGVIGTGEGGVTGHIDAAATRMRMHPAVTTHNTMIK
jgi:hypothetical protein